MIAIGEINVTWDYRCSYTLAYTKAVFTPTNKPYVYSPISWNITVWQFRCEWLYNNKLISGRMTHALCERLYINDLLSNLTRSISSKCFKTNNLKQLKIAGWYRAAVVVWKQFKLLEENNTCRRVPDEHFLHSGDADAETLNVKLFLTALQFREHLRETLLTFVGQDEGEFICAHVGVSKH